MILCDASWYKESSLQNIVGGITGTKVVRYDIYGQDVQIANKMESNGEQGNVAVSEVTKELLEEFYPDTYKFEFHKEVKVGNSKVFNLFLVNQN